MRGQEGRAADMTLSILSLIIVLLVIVTTLTGVLWGVWYERRYWTGRKLR